MLRDVKSRISPVTILVAIVMLLVPALAWMQYQWLGQLSEAERERMQRTLRTAAAQFANEFDTELSRTLITLQMDGTILRDQNWSAYAQRYSQWAASVSDPRLVRDVWLVDVVPGTELPILGSDVQVPVERLRIRQWNTQSLTFEDAQWPEDLVRLRESLATRFIGVQSARGRELAARHDTTMALTLGDDTTLISPVTHIEFEENRLGPPRIAILGFTIVRLDPNVIRDTMLTTLAARHFNNTDSELNYRVAVMQRDNEKQVVWESEPGAATIVAVRPDVTQSFMGPRPDQMFIYARGGRGGVPLPPASIAGNREPGAGNRIPDPGSRSPAEESKVVISMVEREDRVNGGRIITRAGGLSLEGRWVLVAQHRSGSLEQAVAAVRQRNLWISSGVLMLLTLAVALIVVSARRAQALARQQMEFVAAVSHELRTPVSVIGAAAGNLADGVVGDPQRVRKYGETIQGEARRLAETVERVLQLAGIAAGRAAAAQTPIAPADLIHESISACRPEIDAAAVNVEVAVADGLPDVVGDVAALKSALQNVISNAVKYGGAARWVRVSASLEAPRSGLAMTVDKGFGQHRGRKVFFAVEDRGIGIDADDRKHIFEPFYRGRDAVSQQIQGSGLGLNLVMRIVGAHGGHVMVNSEPGKGSIFTLALPAAAESESVPLAREATSPR